MFYVKEKISDSAELKVEVTDENVFGRCPLCGKEIEIDLVDLFKDRDADLYSTQVLCPACSKNIVKKEY